VLRIFKISRYSSGMQILGSALYASRAELSHLVLFTAIGTVLFSSAVYYAEREVENPSGHEFISIPMGFWWSIQTMTTLGYGDITPQTLVGRLVGTVCCLSGVVLLALPVPIFVRNFQRLFDRRKKEALKRLKTLQGQEPGYDPTGGMTRTSFAIPVWEPSAGVDDRDTPVQLPLEMEHRLEHEIGKNPFGPPSGSEGDDEEDRAAHMVDAVMGTAGNGAAALETADSPVFRESAMDWMGAGGLEALDVGGLKIPSPTRRRRSLRRTRSLSADGTWLSCWCAPC
jgi:hypothetical protein